MNGESPRYVPPGLIDFRAAGLPEYDGCYAIVLDSLFSKPELTTALKEGEDSSPWQIAQINAGTEVFTDMETRNGQRIIHDSFTLSARLFAKMRPHLGAIEEIEEQTYVRGVGPAVQKWRMVRLNERLRYLRYPPGGYFRPHVDGYYENEENGQRTFYTLQLYLPSDASGSDQSFLPAEGGSTRFLNWDGAYADVEAIPGRALIFQMPKLLHTGEEVKAGVKVTIRSDILYEKVGKPIPVQRDVL
ncbi:oxidoreductase domain-containing protein [Mycena maculata]|uniref:Oxidoreductase domain-containing protein n=1 Tax=Mycena maculata TaxID=230809 RepID=A0AAD7JAN2_9AGAR|nr:oxidoreductase domain-containing protein [Mycena maculata]